jgi:DNA-binding response OmpR family regulator
MAEMLKRLKDEVMARPEHERLPYAIELLDFYLSPVPAFVQGCGALDAGLTHKDVRLLWALDRQRGMYISKDALISAAHADEPVEDWPSFNAVALRLVRIRRVLKGAGLPVKIVTWAGVGMCLQAPSSFRFEDLARGRLV